jgi:hypothetical protein
MKIITLATLDSSTEQEVFDFVANHLLTQNEKSRNTGKCLYKSPKGLKCAAGALIADDEYKESFDDYQESSWSNITQEYGITKTHLGLISELQGIHDRREPVEWFGKLEELAKDYELNFTFIREKFPQA